MVLLKEHVAASMKYVLLQESAQVHNIILADTKLLRFVSIDIIVWLIFICFPDNFRVIFLSECVNDNGEAGDGTAKGTCSGTDEVCTALGECLGT